MRAWGFVLLAGCFGPAAPLGAPCAPEGAGDRCPAGQVCLFVGGQEVCVDERPAPGPDAPGDGLPPDACTTCTPTDDDGDGVLDTSDNCPNIANADQADEDGAEGGDACDPCPPFAGSADTDGDGLPDNCDPHPTVPGDQLREFSGFKSGLPLGWTAVNFAADGNGDVVGTAAANGGATLTIARPAGNLSVWADATLESIAGTALGAIGVMTLSEKAVDDNVVCQVVGNANDTSQKLRLFDNAGGTGLIAEADHAFAPGLHFGIRVEQTGTALHCEASQPNVEINGSSSYAPAEPEIGLRVRSATARYHWMMVIQSP